MLEQHEVAGYLLRRRLISRRSIVAGQLSISDASSRNRNHRVSGRPGSGEHLLLKQALADDGAATLANEFALYRRLAREGAAVAALAPRAIAYDPARSLLTLEWIAGGIDLYRLHRSRRAASATLAGALGRALATLHGVAPDAEELRRDAPWVLSLHRPPLDALRYLSAGSVELIRAIQHDGPFAAALDELRDGWRVEALVHRDVKWANCVAHPAPGRARLTRIALVDWEMAGWGDPALDVGSALGELLAFRLGSIPDDLDADELDLAAASERPVAAVAPALRALWRAYVRTRGLPPGCAAQLAGRALAHAGARLVQSGYEDTQQDGRFSARIARGLALARTLLVDPRAACEDLLDGGAR